MALKRTLVTGVGRRRGIGAALALGLAADGWDLALSYWHPYDDRLGLGRSADDLDTLADEIRGLGRDVVLLPPTSRNRAPARRSSSRRPQGAGRCPGWCWRTASR